MAQEGGSYSLVIRPPNKKTQAIFNFRKDSQSFSFETNKPKLITFENVKVGSSNSLNFSMTLFDNDICFTKVIKVTATTTKIHTFIQLDKPVYKPGDLVQFRILILDQDLKPFHMNNLDVLIIDPVDRVIEKFDDPGEQYLGVFEEKFELAPETALGNWRIKVIVNGKKQQPTVKSFSVIKYTLPLFDVDVKTSQKNILRKSAVKISFDAKYSFGQFVTGHAKLTIKNVESGQVYKSETFENVRDKTEVTYKIIDDLQVEDKEVNVLEATVSYTEPESQVTVNKTTRFNVVSSASHKIVPIHPETFTPGTSFTLGAFVTDWKDKRVLNSTTMVVMTYAFKMDKLRLKTVKVMKKLRNGAVEHVLDVFENVTGIDVSIKFDDSKLYKMTILPGAATAFGRDALAVEYSPVR